MVWNRQSFTIAGRTDSLKFDVAAGLRNDLKAESPQDGYDLSPTKPLKPAQWKTPTRR
jgi:hypothetical protein